jgi:hypothetical protein
LVDWDSRIGDRDSPWECTGGRWKISTRSADDFAEALDLIIGEESDFLKVVDPCSSTSLGSGFSIRSESLRLA